MSSSTPPRILSQEVWERPFVKAHEKWCRAFVLELRLRNVPGPVIGERLAEVEAHCAETGGAPSEAFGAPTDYAARVDQDGAPDRVSGVWAVTAAVSAQVLAMLVGTSAVSAWAGGDSLTYNVGQVLCFALILLVVLTLPLSLSPMVRHPWTVGVPLVSVGLLGAGGAALSGRADLPTLGLLPAPVVAVGLFLAVLGLAWVVYRELARDGGDDLVTSPLRATSGHLAATGGRGRRATLALACLIPAAYLGLSAFSWLVT